ncbi:unnamed protein product [Phaedon cochleariae]|uniref:Uncharacterized protein n=1 Tax=Phaedon cochleariae TaxID=80249 RepID=A0A9N9X1F6_PHACE|nr:unnamed protein product [Phaedon cochleariae]
MMNQMNIPNCSSFITPHDDEGQDLGDIPLIRQIDNIRILPKYSSVLSKSGDDRVCMDDLDQLQFDLEKLCSTCTVRIRYLLSEIGEADRNIEGSDHTVHEKKSFKRKLAEEILMNPDFRKKMSENENSMVETFFTPLTQRLLAALIEEKVVTNHSTNGESAPPVSNNLKLSESTKLKTSTGGQKVPCIDRRLKKKLMKQGIISMDDLSKTWQDLKKNTKKKTSEMKKYARGTGGGPSVPPLKTITEDDENILKLLEPTAVDGDHLVQESVVLFDHDYDYTINKDDMVSEITEEVATENEIMQDQENLDSNQINKTNTNKKCKRVVAAKRLSESLKTSQNISRIPEKKVSSKDKYYSQKIDLYTRDVEAKERIAKALETIVEKNINIF